MQVVETPGAKDVTGQVTATAVAGEVAVLDGTRTLATAGIAIERMEPDWRNRVLAALANPQVALILMMIGIYGLFFEFTTPGFGVPGWPAPSPCCSPCTPSTCCR